MPVQEIEVEVGGDAGGVVVGGVEQGGVFFEVDADQQAAAGRTERGGGAENVRASWGSKLPIVDPGK